MDIRRRPPNPSVQVAHLEYAIPHEDAEPRHILEKIVWEKDREVETCLLYTSPSPRDKRQSRMPSSA